MRTSFSRITTFVAIFFTCAAVSLTGCQNSFKMPSTPSWMSWNKSKPASSSLASRPPDTKLPSPSATASPSHPPSYAQRGGTGPSNATRPGGNYYSNASYGTTGTNPNTPASGASSARGFYSPQYAKGGAQPSATGAYGNRTPSYAGSPQPSGTGSSYNSYGPNGFAPSSGAPATGQTWPSNAQASQYGTAPRASVGDNGYSRTATRNTATNSYGTPPPANDYPRDSASYGGTPSTYSSPKSASPYSGASSPASASPTPKSAPAVASDGYRPGSTSRNTQFGDSQNINVAGLRGIQPASYGTGNDVSAGSPVTNGSQAPPPATYGTQGSRTATGQQYPTTSPSIYR